MPNRFGSGKSNEPRVRRCRHPSTAHEPSQRGREHVYQSLDVSYTLSAYIEHGTLSTEHRRDMSDEIMIRVSTLTM